MVRHRQAGEVSLRLPEPLHSSSRPPLARMQRWGTGLEHLLPVSRPHPEYAHRHPSHWCIAINSSSVVQLAIIDSSLNALGNSNGRQRSNRPSRTWTSAVGSTDPHPIPSQSSTHCSACGSPLSPHQAAHDAAGRHRIPGGPSARNGGVHLSLRFRVHP